MARPTKQELESEVEDLRSRLEDAHEIISEALGYDDDEERDEDEDDDE